MRTTLDTINFWNKTEDGIKLTPRLIEGLSNSLKISSPVKRTLPYRGLVSVRKLEDYEIHPVYTVQRDLIYAPLSMKGPAFKRFKTKKEVSAWITRKGATIMDPKYSSTKSANKYFEYIIEQIVDDEDFVKLSLLPDSSYTIVQCPVSDQFVLVFTHADSIDNETKLLFRTQHSYVSIIRGMLMSAFPNMDTNFRHRIAQPALFSSGVYTFKGIHYCNIDYPKGKSVEDKHVVKS